MTPGHAELGVEGVIGLAQEAGAELTLDYSLPGIFLLTGCLCCAHLLWLLPILLTLLHTHGLLLLLLKDGILLLHLKDGILFLLLEDGLLLLLLEDGLLLLLLEDGLVHSYLLETRPLVDWLWQSSGRSLP